MAAEGPEKKPRRYRAQIITQDAKREQKLGLRLALKELGFEDDVDLDLNVELYFDRFVEIYVDCPEKAIAKKRHLRVLFLMEPEAVSGARGRLDRTKFDYIFGRGEIFFGFGGTWVPRDLIGAHEKTKLCSMICGDKLKTEGHRLRKEIFKKIDVTRFVSSRTQTKLEGLLLGSEIRAKARDAIAPFKYHVAIENVKENGYFTEKIIDCFLLKTVPMYWGCPDIASFFDVDGILLLPDDVDAIVSTINVELSDDNYQKRQNAVDRNFHLAHAWIDLQPRMQSAIDNVLPPATPPASCPVFRQTEDLFLLPFYL